MFRFLILCLALAQCAQCGVFFIPATSQRPNTLPNDPLLTWNGGTNVVPFYNPTNIYRNEFQWGWNNTGQASDLITNGGGTSVVAEVSGTVDANIASAWRFKSSAPNVLMIFIESSGILLAHEDYVNTRWWTNIANGRTGAYINNTGVVNTIASGGVINSQHAQTQMGIAIMAGNNGKGGAGVVKDSNYVMNIQFDTIADMAACLDFALTNAVDMKKIISIGVSTSDPRWTNQLQRAFDSNILVVCPFNESGNRNYDTTGSFDHLRLDFPAALQYWSWTNFAGGVGTIEGTNVGVFNFPRTGPLLTNIISVGPIIRDGSFFSAGLADYSTNYLNVCAPGRTVISTHTNGGYTFVSGTSPACVFATSLAALIWEQNPAWDWRQVRNRMFNTVTTTASLATNCSTGGYLNMGRALDPGVVASIETSTDILGPWEKYLGPIVVEANEPKRFWRYP